MSRKMGGLKIIATYLLGIVLLGVCFQAPISVVADVAMPGWALAIKAWKEIILGIVAIITSIYLWQSGKWREFVADKLLWLCAAVALVNVLSILVFTNHPLGEAAALLVSLRIYLIFALTYILVKVHPPAKKILLSWVGVGMAVVCIFGLLQVIALPKNTLEMIGYSERTIQPYLTVDKNPDFVRINSTLRGPNPLGAFAVVVVSLILAMLFGGKKISGWRLGLVLAIGFSALVALWFSYSRSAWLAMLVAGLVLVMIYQVGKILNRYKKATLIVSAAAIAVLCLVVGSLNSDFIQNVIFHNNPTSDSLAKSDHEHMNSLVDGINHTIEAPFGMGPGSVGSPSLLTDKPRIVENQYFYTTAETGWVGLALQLGLFGLVMWRLFLGRKDWLAAGMLASGFGMAVVGLVLPVWADDTVGIVWWALAGIAVAVLSTKSKHKTRSKNA